MLTSVLAAFSLAQAQSAAVLILRGDTFEVGYGPAKPILVPAKPEERLVRTTYRKDETSVSWGASGLTISTPTWNYTTRFEAAALSPKLFSVAEIIQTKTDIEAGTRQQGADAMSGSGRIGSFAYFLLGWHDSKGSPWLEALVRVNLGAAQPKPELVGRFTGMSMAVGEASDELKLVQGGFKVVTRHPEGAWGVAAYSTKTGTFTFTPRASRMDQAWPDGDGFYVATKTTYGKSILSYVSPANKARPLAEVDGVRMVYGGMMPTALIETHIGLALLDLKSGREVNLPAKPIVRQTGLGYLVWPEGAPQKAVLLSVSDFSKIASVRGCDLTGGPGWRTLSRG